MEDKHNMSTDSCSLFNSNVPHAEGKVFVLCSCGWKSEPVREKDAVQLFTTHVIQQVK